MRMSTILHCAQIRRRHLLALFNAGYLHKNNCIAVAQFSTKMPWIRPMPVLKFDRTVSAFSGQQLRCFNPYSNYEELLAEFDNATKVAAFPLGNERKLVQKTVDGHRILAQRRFPPAAQHSGGEQPEFVVKYELGTTGQKTMRICQRHLNEFFNFKKILVPEDIFSFVQAMDEVLNAVHAKRNEIERITGDKRLHIVKAKGRYYDYQMKLAIHNRIVEVQLQSVPNAATPAEHKPKWMILPLPAFHWLRQSIGEILAEHGEKSVQQQLAKPADYPNWLTPDDSLQIRREQLADGSIKSCPLESDILSNEMNKIENYYEEEARKRPQILEEPELSVDGDTSRGKALARRTYPNGADEERKLGIGYHVGRSGWKYFQIAESIGSDNEISTFPNVHVPKDVPGFVQAMDELLGVLDANRKEIEAQLHQKKEMLLHTVKAKGLMFDFQMELYIYKNGRVHVRLRTVPNEQNPEHKSRHLHVHLGKFHWLRQSIGEILAEHGEEGVQQQLAKLPDYPAWVTSDGFPLARAKLPPMQQIADGSKKAFHLESHVHGPQNLKEIEQFIASQKRSQLKTIQTTLNRVKSLARRTYPADADRPLYLAYEIGKSGWKYIQFAQTIESKMYEFPKIIVPEDILQFVQAMDQLLDFDALWAKRGEIEAPFHRNKDLLLRTVKAKGLRYDFQMELIARNKYVYVHLCTVPNEHKPEHKSSYAHLHIGKFHWLRQSIGEILAEHGDEVVQQQLGKPHDYPTWLTPDGQIADGSKNSFPLGRDALSNEMKEIKNHYEEEARMESAQILATRTCPNGADHPLQINYKIGKSGWKFFEFTQQHVESKISGFPNVNVTEDILQFLHAMDELLGNLDAKRSEVEAQSHREENHLLHTVKAKGRKYDFQMELSIHKNTHVHVHLHTVPNLMKPEHKPKFMHLPFPQFHWLRQSIGEILAEHGDEGVQQQLAKPPDYPNWLTPDGFPRALSKDPRMQQIADGLKDSSEIQNDQQEAKQPQNWKEIEQFVTGRNNRKARLTRAKTLAKRTYPEDANRQLHISYIVGKNGFKFLSFEEEQSFGAGVRNFSNVNVPGDVPGFVQAMDELLGVLDAKKGRIEEPMRESEVLHTAQAKGLMYDFKMELFISKNKHVSVFMRTVPNLIKPEHTPKRMRLSIAKFHWLRQSIGDIMAEHGEKDVQQQIGKVPDLPNGSRHAHGEPQSKQQQQIAMRSTNSPRLPRKNFSISDLIKF